MRDAASGPASPATYGALIVAATRRRATMDVQGFLADLRRRLRRVLWLDGLARLVVLALVGCAVAVLIDYCWPIPGGVRLVALSGIVVGVVAMCRSRLVRPLGRPMDDRALAQFAERRLPTLDGRLLTRVDGIDIGASDGRVLGETLTPSALVALVPAVGMPRRVLLAGSVLLALAVITVLFPRPVQDGFARLFLPFGATEWERRSTLVGELERPVVAADEPLVVRLRRSKGPDAPLRLHWLPEGGGAGERRMLSGLGGPWIQALNLPTGAYRLIAESGDAQPLVLHGLVVSRPALAQIEATLTPPAYTRLAPQKLGTLGCAALPGSRLDFAVAFSLDAGRHVVDAGASLGDAALPVETTATGLKGALTVTKGGVITLRLADQDAIAPSPAPRFTLVLAEDRKPVVALGGPRSKEAVTARAELAVAVDASDDYALATLVLSAAAFSDEPPAEGGGSRKPADKPSKESQTAFPDVKGLAATTRRSLVKVADLAKEGDRVVLIARASDANDVTGPGLGESPPLELRVVSESELRQEFDRLLTEARDRVVQAREEIAQGLAKPERLTLTGRGATLAATKAGEILAQVTRRWAENKLPPEQAVPVGRAGELVNAQALPRLAEMASGQEPSARAADTHLAEAEKLLAGLLTEGDLTRVLASLVEREKSLSEESRAFVRDHLTKPLDEAAKRRQANLAARQKELADAVKEVERRILASPSKQLEKAQDLVRSETPADQLQQAAAKLGADTQRPQAIPHQESAIATLTKLLDQLRGSDAAADLAKKAGELAVRQEQLVKQLEEGANPRELAAEQRKLKDDTEQFGKQLDKQPQAAKPVAAAAQAQDAAAKADDQSDRSAAAREGAAAASLLREAQKALGKEEDQDKDDKKKDKKSPDVLALLKELHKQQAAVVADSALIFQRLGDKPLDFAATRDVPALAEREQDILLRLKEEGAKELEQMPIALVALGRVATALDKAGQHLATPALGERGMRLEKIALYELTRLIEIAENIPSPEQQEKGGGGKGDGGGNQAPFPPAAQIALLAAQQEELAALTAANRPVELAAMQHEVGELTKLLLDHTRPGSRPHLLLARAHRAMGSAEGLLGASDRGTTTRHEQAAAEAALRRILAEAKGSGGGKGSPQPQQKPQSGGKPPPPAPSPGNQGGANSPGGNAGGTKADGKGRDGTVVVDGGPERGEFLNLPQERREQLKQAREQPLPPGALPVFERYLELLEEKR
jgi:hypothetical protein